MQNTVIQPELADKITSNEIEAWAYNQNVYYGWNITQLKACVLGQWHWTRAEINVTRVTVHGLLKRRLAVTEHGLAGAVERMEGKGLFFTQWSNWHPCESDIHVRVPGSGREVKGTGYLVHGPHASLLWASHPAALVEIQHLSVVHKKNYHLTWEHGGEIQCSLTGSTGWRANLAPRGAAQWAEAFHLWGAQSGGRGCIPWGCLHGTNSPLVQHHRQLPPSRKPKQNQQERARHGLHQHSWRENSADTFWEGKKSDFWFIKLLQAWERKLSGSVGRFWEGSSQYTGEWQTTLNFSGRRLSCGIMCIYLQKFIKNRLCLIYKANR